MPNRILDFSQKPLRLRTRLKQLVVEPEGAAAQTIPLEDIAVVVVSHPQITFSQSVLAEIAENGGVAVFCNKKSLPVGIYTPLNGHHQPARRLALQIAAPLPVRKRAWQQIVKAKIKAQAHLLNEIFCYDKGLSAMSQRVKSGDTANVEAQAARRYWQQLFDGHSFHRNPDGDDPINIRLNFGYSVLRGIVARAICASGFHPAIGIHHHNQYNGYCLADDLMEPFRPVVDRIVQRQINAVKFDTELTPDVKTEIIRPLLLRFSFDGELLTLFESVLIIAASLVPVFAKEKDELLLPKSFEPVEEEKPF